MRTCRALPRSRPLRREARPGKPPPRRMARRARRRRSRQRRLRHGSHRRPPDRLPHRFPHRSLPHRLPQPHAKRPARMRAMAQRSAARILQSAAHAHRAPRCRRPRKAAVRRHAASAPAATIRLRAPGQTQPVRGARARASRCFAQARKAPDGQARSPASGAQARSA